MSPRRLLGAIALASLALTSIAHGQTPDAGRADAAPPADAGLAADAGPADRDELLGRRQAIETLIAGIPAEATDEASLARRQELGRQIELIDQMRAAVADRARRLNAVADDSRERQSLDTELRAFTALPPPGAPAQVNAEDVGRVEAEVEANRRTVAALDAEVTRAEARLAELPRLIAEARRRGRTATELSRALAAQLATLPLGDARDQLALRLDTARLDARAGAEVAEDLEVEQAMLQASGRLLTQQRDLARRQLARSEQILELHRKAYESTLTEKQADVDRALVAAREALIEARDRPGTFLATWRVRLIESQVKLAEANRLRLSVARTLAQQGKLLEADASELRGLQGLVEGADASERIADKLKEIALRLDRRHEELDRVRHLPEVSAAQIARTRRFEVSDLLYEIDEPWRAETEMIETGLSATERGAFAEAARKLREQVRDALRDEQNALAELLAEGEALRGALAERVETLDQLDAFVRARVFWVQDAPPLGREVWRQAKNDIARLRIWLAGPALRRPEGTQPGWPLVWTGAVVALLSLVLALVHLRLRRVMRGLRADDDLPLMQRLRFAIVGLLSAGLLPLWVWLLGHLAAATDLPPALLAPVRAALTHAALALAALHLGRFLFRPGGFAEGELNLRPETAAALRKAVQILAGGYALFLAPRSALVAGPLRLDALPRLLYTLADMTAIYTLIRLGRPRSPIIRDLLHQLSRPGLARFVPPIGAFLLVFGLLIISMDVLGYRFGAAWLADRSLWSLGALVGLYLLYPVIRRALAVRLGNVLTPRNATLEEQARRGTRLINTLMLLVVVLGLAGIWELDQRAVALLDGLHIYTPSGDGAQPVSVADVLGAVLTIVITVWVLRLLPRLLDTLIFPYLDFDDGARYAIVTITRYGFFFIGLLITFDSLNIDLSKLGWLVAAVGVGLGFGLQEVVANFFSGLILLLERPIRIGDWITVGTVEGSVQTINIRATTVMTLDRQEIIVPNKDFITKDVVNWTHSDRIARLRVPIGVAYGTDVDKVIALLLEVARKHPTVLADPPPQALLMAHGESSLDFELRVHYLEPRGRNPLLSALNVAINRALAEAGIEIPFPQRDLHVRSGTLRIARDDDADEP